jgi:hypothetical protein
MTLATYKFDNVLQLQLIDSTMCYYCNLQIREFVTTATYRFDNLSLFENSTICRSTTFHSDFDKITILFMEKIF